MMSTGRRIVMLFLAAVVLTIAGVFMFIAHVPAGQSVLWVGMLAQVASLGAFLWHISRRKP